MPAERAIASQQVFSRAQTPIESRLARKHSTTGSSEMRIAPSIALGLSPFFKSGVMWGALGKLVSRNTQLSERPSSARCAGETDVVLTLIRRFHRSSPVGLTPRGLRRS